MVASCFIASNVLGVLLCVWDDIFSTDSYMLSCRKVTLSAVCSNACFWCAFGGTVRRCSSLAPTSYQTFLKNRVFDDLDSFEDQL
ncbi:hypothetical protein CEXT_459661 [Caerostris extrusa]|uniref:Secreted protein n=1 Tax=Caerostris extrusa TaxID=172846 RepID=A0AAV4QTF2_CAEEX|nr:hypothetical protein CEXT_459661 [Caerostris extrusa]